jgi:hypothetical protein
MPALPPLHVESNPVELKAALFRVSSTSQSFLDLLPKDVASAVQLGAPGQLWCYVEKRSRGAVRYHVTVEVHGHAPVSVGWCSAWRTTQALHALALTIGWTVVEELRWRHRDFDPFMVLR